MFYKIIESALTYLIAIEKQVFRAYKNSTSFREMIHPLNILGDPETSLLDPRPVLGMEST